MSTSTVGPGTTTLDPDSTSGSSSSSEVDDGTVDSGPPPEPVCGDGMVDPDEECDDGNNTDDDGCNRDCIDPSSIVWETIIEAEGDGACARDLAVSPTGLIGVGGWTRMGPRAVNAWAGVLSDDGAVQWTDQWDGGGNTRDEVMSVGFDGAGDLYLFVTESPSTQRAVLYKRSPDGTELWSQPLPAMPGEDSVAEQLVVGPDDGVAVLARTFDSPEGLRLARFAPDGTQAWPGVVDLTEGGDGIVLVNQPTLSGDPTGDLLMVVLRDSDEDFWHDAFLERYSIDGTPIWSVQSNPPVLDHGDVGALGAVRADGTGTLVLYDAFAPDDLVLRSWDSAGVGPDTVAPGLGRALRLEEAVYDAAGTLYIVGNDSDAGWVVAVDAVGALSWVRRTTGQGSARINTVAIAANGDVLVAGCLHSTEGDVWIRRYTP